MAHFEKFQAGALGSMCAHYERRPELERGYRRANIDPQRTHLNYNLGPERRCSQVDFINDRIGELDLKRAPRKDAVRMVDCVLTLPRSFDRGRADEFFQVAYDQMADRFGRANVVSAYVHMDETTPHMHFAFVPVTGDGRLSAKDVLNRNELMRFHGELQDGMERELGCRCEICLDERTRADRAAQYVDLPPSS